MTFPVLHRQQRCIHGCRQRRCRQHRRRPDRRSLGWCPGWSRPGRPSSGVGDVAVMIFVTTMYSALLLWGLVVGVRQIYQGLRQPGKLLNTLFANRIAVLLFSVHVVVVTVDLFVVGPWAVAHKSTLWYWGGRVALFTSAMPIAAYLNRNPQSFGKLIGGWVTGRNIFEYTAHVVVAALPANWFAYYLLLWWLVAYRYLDVGPRRLLQRLYNTPRRRA